MPIAGALVVPVKREEEETLGLKLGTVPGVEVQETGPKGIAIVLEASSTGELKKISQAIEQWDDVLEFELAYFNWEDETA
ncbi:MAG: hypothetical protein Kow0089_22770 [Desulfobulbaceae bacterium]